MSLWRLIWRESLGAGGMGLLLAALVLAVTATTTLQFTTALLRDAVGQQSGQLLGADVVVSSSEPLRPVWQTRTRGLTQTSVLVFASMAQANGQFVLVNVKAVQAGYPLRGALTLQPNRLAAGQAPERGTVWLEPRVMTLLNARVGQTITLGDASLRVAGQLLRDPNRETGMSGFSPTVLMAQEDVAATRAVQVGSRLDYRLLLSGSPQQMRQVMQQWEKKLHSNEQLRSATEGNTRLLKPMGFLNDYAQIASVMTLLLCGIAVALSAQRLVLRQADSMALLRCLGASQAQLAAAYGLLLLTLWAVAVLLGGVLGMAGGWALLALLRQGLAGLSIPFEPLAVLQGPVLTAVLTAGLLLLGFALPHVLRLLRVSPLKMLRRESLPLSWSGVAVVGLAWSALWVFLVLQTGKWMLSVALLVGLSGVLLLLWLGVWGVLTGLKRRGIAVDGLARQPLHSSVQVLALGLGAGLIGVVLLLRGDLLQHWQQSLPANTPNQFVYGLAPDQKAAFEQALKQRQWSASPLYPMIKGRLVAHNGRPFRGEAAKDRSLSRELNLTTSAVLPADNILTAGTPFTGPRQVSVEAALAERLGLRVGDQISMSLPEGTLVARITSLRTVQWDRFSPNFFFIYSPQSLDAQSGSYLGSFYVPLTDQAQLALLIQAFPTALLIDVGALLAEVKRLLALLGQGLGLLSVLVTAAGVLVLLASVRMMVDQRQADMALLRVLGLSRQQLRRHVLGEMAALGLSAGLVAVLLAESLGWVLAWRLQLPMQWHPWWWAVFPLSLMLLTVGVAVAPLSRLWRQSPLQVLRRV